MSPNSLWTSENLTHRQELQLWAGPTGGVALSRVALKGQFLVRAVQIVIWCNSAGTREANLRASCK